MYSRKWLIFTLVACGLASACSSYNTNLSIQTSSSTLSYVSPASATVGGGGFTITANGTGYTSGALILWNGKALITTLINSGQLTAPVPASDLAAAGTVQIAVQIPGSAQSGTNINAVNSTTTTEISNIVLFTVAALPATPPAITSLSASTTSAASTPYCSAQGFALTVNGTNFTSDAIVNWNGSGRTTTFVSSTQITAAVTPVDTAFPGSAMVNVSNSAGTSNALSFTMSTPATPLPPPTLTSVTPNSAAAGSPPFTLSPLNPQTLLPVNALVVTASQGTFLPCTAVQWADSNNVKTTLPTIYIPATAAIPATATTPAIPAHPLQLNAAVPAVDLVGAAAVQTAHVALINPAPAGPGGNTSQQIPFTISPPIISGLSASTSSSNSTPSCSASAVTLTVTGANFVNGSVVEWAVNPPPALPASLATTFVSSTQLTAVIPASLIASPGNVNIEVSNNGVLSNTSSFSVAASSPPAPTIASISPLTATAGAAGTTLIVTGTNLLPCSVVQWTNGAGTTTPLASTYVGATQTSAAQLSALVPAADIAAVGTAQVDVATPASSANTSNAVSFPIVLPTITSLSASTTGLNETPHCSAAGITLTVNGTGFANGLVVNWNGSPRPTTLVSATQLTAAITAADTAYLATGAAEVAITVSGGSGTNSKAARFSLTDLPATAPLPLPNISSLRPSNAAAEALTGAPVAMTANGSGMSPCSVAQWNGNPLPVTIFVGTSGIATVIPAANVTTAGLNQVSVFSPALPSSECTPSPTVNCGGTSSNRPFTVYTPGSPVPSSITGAPLSLPLMSSNQRYGVFVLASTDGVTENPETTQNIFVSDTCAGVPSGCAPSTTLVSVGLNGLNSVPANGDSIFPAISSNATGAAADASADGRYVSFLSSATNLVAGGTAGGIVNAFVRDTCAGVTSGCRPSTQLVSVSTGGAQANGATSSATIDATGRYITFESAATNLGSSSAPAFYLRDTCAGVLSGCTPSTQPLD